ncbi:MAG: hypothetical protein QM661_09600 [Solimonas sp.]
MSAAFTVGLDAEPLALVDAALLEISRARASLAVICDDGLASFHEVDDEMQSVYLNGIAERMDNLKVLLGALWEAFRDVSKDKEVRS